MSDSIWSDGGRIQMPQYEKLTRIKKVDVTIVGGGLCGLLCAYFLKEAGVECLLLEGSRIASGTVRHAMAQVTSQHGPLYTADCWKLWGKRKPACTLKRMNSHCVSIGNWQHL